MKLTVPTNPNYEIEIERGSVLERRLPEGFIVTDTNVAKAYSDLLKDRQSIIIEAGEKSKSIETYLRIVHVLENTCPDVEAIISFGGGVVGDLTGFVASAYRRGTALIQVPTTLLAMVDSSIGGKNGINLEKKKNQLGTIYQPKRVIIDPGFLTTLPLTEFRNGVAEIIKCAILFGQPSLGRFCQELNFSDEDLEDIISDCCFNKAKIVGDDEFDKGLRHVLNLGHTFGHAVELLYELRHGEAISMGMVNELDMANDLGIEIEEKVREVRKALKANELPTEFPKGFEPDKIIEIMKSDKKGAFVFAFSTTNYNVELSEEQVRKFLFAK